MTDSIKIRIKTLSNLFIGGMPLPFEIGGIDQQTAIDQDGFPCIPASSLKGTLRAIVREDQSALAEDIKQVYESYLEEEKKNNLPQIEQLVTEQEARARIDKRYSEVRNRLSPEYLFGIEGLNNTPKLLFSDLLLCREYRDEARCFSIDIKNSIDTTESMPVSNPRTYKAARPGLEFAGEIRFYKIEQLGTAAKELCKNYVIANLLKFNEGFYRLGNSKSRGYGRIEVCIEKQNGEQIL